jgi:hypothetical protein
LTSGGRDLFAEPLLQALQNVGFSTIITPTVVFELGYLASHPKEDCHEEAENALAGILGWKITPMALPRLKNELSNCSQTS